MPTPFNTWGSLMSYPANVDSGGIIPTYLGSDTAEVGAGGTTGGMTANAVYLLAVTVTAACIVSGMRVHIGSTATGTTDMGIYDFNGNLLVHTGAVANTVATTMTNNFSAIYVLGPGNYYLACCPSNATDTYSKVPTIAVPGSISNFRLATNAGSSGVLPSTLGTILAPSGASPVFGGVVAGGLP
jgi:hypothetical protein